MSHLLHIETATTVCSVALAENEKILFSKELNEGFTHAENLHLFIQEALKTTGLSVTQLNAVAVSKGPGSYTGLRIGVSAAKGLAYALNIPLIGVDTLQIMTRAAVKLSQKEGLYCPMIDARRMEIYTALYGKDLKPQTPVEALIVDQQSISKFDTGEPIFYFGDGMAKCRELLNTLPTAFFIENIAPSADNMAELAFAKFTNKDFEDLAYFEPFYLKDFLAGKKSTKA